MNIIGYQVLFVNAFDPLHASESDPSVPLLKFF